MPRRLKRPETGDCAEAQHNIDVWEVMKTSVDGGTDSSRLLELYYWSQEPGVLELIRVFLEMNESTRLTVGNFMLTARPQSIVATFDASGRLVLSQSDKGDDRAENHRQSPEV